MTIYTVNRLLKEFGMERTGYLASLPLHYLYYPTRELAHTQTTI